MVANGVHPSSGSPPTSLTLLERVRAREQAAWERFVRLYAPLVYGWCRLADLQEADATDVGQEVFYALIGNVGRFRHDRPGDSFRAWLRVITRNKVRDFVRRRDEPGRGAGGSDAAQGLQQLADVAVSAEEDEDERALVHRRALELLLDGCEPRTRDAFWRVVVEGQAAADVAADLGLTVNAIYLLKSRLLRRLRVEFAGCVEL